LRPAIHVISDKDHGGILKLARLYIRIDHRNQPHQKIAATVDVSDDVERDIGIWLSAKLLLPHECLVQPVLCFS